MATPFRLTARPIRVTGAAKMDLQDSLDITAYDEIDIMCVLCGLTGATTGLVIKILTGMQIETEDGWTTAGSFTAASLDTLGDAEAINIREKLFRFIRWEVTSVGGATSMTFDLSGMLRRR